ncbi:IS982 family transposase [Cyanobacterium sp. HL-69]|nr:IS982 family transposase [Cyanobacterium sp. HL-69]
MSSLDELFCHVDDWAQTFEPLFQKQLLSSGVGKRIEPIWYLVEY